MKKIILNPENIEINLDGVKNFFWPVKFNEGNNFKNVLLKKLILNLKSETNTDIVKMSIPFIARDVANFFIAKKFLKYFMKLKTSHDKTGNDLIDDILLKEKISLPQGISIILKGLKKKKLIFSKLKKIKSFFLSRNLSYIDKKKIKQNHRITFSNNLLIRRESMNLNNKFEVKTSNFQDWFPSGSIKIEIEKEYMKKKKNFDNLIELTVRYIKKNDLTLNKKEKQYIIDLFFYWIGATDFLLNKLKKNKQYLPKKIWIGSGGNIYNRVFAYLVRNLGGKVWGFDHGMGSGCLNQSSQFQSQFILEFPNIDYFYTFSPYMKKVLKNNFKKNLLNKKFKKKNILNVDTNPSNFFETNCLNNKKILYVPRKYTGKEFIKGLCNYYSDIIYVDWQIRLFNLLNLLKYEINIKPHPTGYSKFPINLSNFYNVKFFNGSFKKVIKKFNLLIFDTIQSSAFFEAIQTNIPIVLLNIKEIDLKKEIKESIQKRCGYVDCYTHNERIKINKDHLSAAIKSSFNLNKDKIFHNCYFKND